MIRDELNSMYMMDYRILNCKKIIIFGTGSLSERFCKEFSLEKIDYFIDNNQSKWNTKFLGKDIKSIDSLKGENVEDIFIIVASSFYYEIAQQLGTLGFIEYSNFCYAYFDIPGTLYLFDRNIPVCDNTQFLLKAVYLLRSLKENFNTDISYDPNNGVTLNILGNKTQSVQSYEEIQNLLYLLEKKITICTETKFLIKSAHLLKLLENKYQSKLTYQPNNGVIVEILNVKLQVKTFEEIAIIVEVFDNKIYNFETQDDLFVIDIGFNIGVTSLFFSLKENVKKVEGFEPFKRTFEQAKLNLELNPELSKKIKVNNFGLSNEDEQLILDFDENYKGSMGVNGLPQFVKNEKNQITRESIILKSASSILNKILDCKEYKFFVKMDCEGSEYKIIEDLSNNKLLNKIHYLVIEWHDKGPEQLINYLNKAGFVCYSMGYTDDTLGLIYAFNQLNK